MSPTSPVLLTACGLATLALSSFLLRQACALWRTELPSYLRAFVSVLLVGATAYLVLDGGGYLLMRLTADAGISLAEDYGYRDWLGELPDLKWQATGLVPGTRYVVIVLALCAAGVVQTFTLGGAANFRLSTLIFLTQGALNAGAFLLLWCLLSVCLGPPDGVDDPAPPAAEVEKPRRLVVRPAASLPGLGPAAEGGLPRPDPPGREELREIGRRIDQLTSRLKAGNEPDLQGEVERLRQRAHQLAREPGDPSPQTGRGNAALTAADASSLKADLARIAAFYQEGHGGRKPSDGPVSKAEIDELCGRLDRLTVGAAGHRPEAPHEPEGGHEASKDSSPPTGTGGEAPGQGSESPEGAGTGGDEAPEAEGQGGYLESVRRSSAPLARRLPRPVQDFLRRGGWWPLIVLFGVLSVFWLESFVRRVQKALAPVSGGEGRKGKERGTPRIRLADLAPAPPGPRSLTVKGLPACLRLIVVAPGGSGMGDLSPDAAYDVLDGIKHGLGHIAWRDQPRLLTWKARYSSSGFPQAFHHACSTAAPPGPSPWVFVAGSITVGKQHFFVGLALLADEPNNLGAVTVRNEQWLDVLGAREGEAV
jgi:hypothetical protein